MYEPRRDWHGYHVNVPGVAWYVKPFLLLVILAERELMQSTHRA